jgi:signal transduction histidine kinase
MLFEEAQLVAATGDVVVDLAGVAPAMLRGSPTDLGRLVRNFVDNAVRHADSTISLAIEIDDSPGTRADEASGAADITLVVGDDGPGINPEDRERIFERFTRLDEARARGDGGSGLGLAIVRHIAANHNAAVSVGESPLGGAEVRVRFTL